MEDYCVACGELVPEGRQVCETCIHNARKKMDYGRELNNDDSRATTKRKITNQ